MSTIDLEGEDKDAIRRARQISSETTVRATFQLRWPAQHVLAWMLTGDDQSIADIDAFRSLEGRTAWDCVLGIVDERLGPHETREQVLWAAFDQLATALGRGKLDGWKCSPPFGVIERLHPDDFARAGLMMGCNSCGLLGATIDPDLLAFVLMWPDDVKATFPRVTPIAEATDTEPARRRGRTPGSGTFAGADAPLVAKMEGLIASGDARSPHGAAQILASEAKGPGTLESKARRLADAYRASRRVGE